MRVTVGNMSGDQFKRVRRRMKLSQAQLARELGVSRAAVSRWESGKRSIDSILALAMDCLAERKGKRHGKRKK
jgi:transcriptional regulator with XRE-family HTH domain